MHRNWRAHVTMTNLGDADSSWRAHRVVVHEDGAHKMMHGPCGSTAGSLKRLQFCTLNGATACSPNTSPALLKPSHSVAASRECEGARADDEETPAHG